MSLKPLKKALQLKPPRTRSRTDMSCPEAGVSQGPDEIVESEAEVISREVNETRSLGSDNCPVCEIYLQIFFINYRFCLQVSKLDCFFFSKYLIVLN